MPILDVAVALEANFCFDTPTGSAYSFQSFEASIKLVVPLWRDVRVSRHTKTDSRHPLQLIRHLLAQRCLTVLICAAALLLKLLVPSGYMIDNDHGRITLTICSGTSPTKTVDLAGIRDEQTDHGPAEMPCAFAGLSAAMLGAIDPIQLAILIAFVMTAGLMAPVLPALSPSAGLRPPSRAPPACL